ncbi:MAG: prolipoprotein diacylglyceryl transferase [Bacteroidota bacterium]|jgi:phosphatidylglycerol:prolipoprotein diacylglycerol transferase|nr:prolipoprotein diacylglyceryl transferase [Ignavibacteria bacterium]MCU7519850.1 prolipoprotein diacylglyceryl transferase [Ignavibacteria bacterium]MCU7524111.1 prolipoprotein diacylglyceryl transferase [Ignavibacteria bacterium]
MMPRLFQIGPFTVYSYGLMLGIAFIIASYVLTKELERRKMDPNIATEITLYAIIFGLIGSKLFYVFENWDAFAANPLGEFFSPGGLTFYGGFLLALAAIFFTIRRKKIPFLVIADATAPSLALAYGIGRIGCHLAGDGDYGIPTNLPWGTNYENGTVPPSYAFRGSEIAKHYPGGVVPDNTPLHPAPVYEFFIAMIIFGILWKLRKKSNWPDGKLFMFYLIFTGTARLSVEFIRLNPKYLFGLTEAQLIAAALIIGGVTGLIFFRNHPALKKWAPPQKEAEPKLAKKTSVK